MGLLTRALTNLIPPRLQVGVTSLSQPTGSFGAPNYQTFARNGYQGNEIVFAAIELLATSAAEPHITGKRWRRNKREIRQASRDLQLKGLQNRAGHMAIDAWLTRNLYLEEVPDHPLVRLLNNPNPFMSRGQLWSTVVMDLKLAGNAYLYKARYNAGLLEGAVGELWRLRPDRVRVVPGKDSTIAAFTYTVRGETVTLPAEDVVFFRTRNPLDEYYGMPPLLPIMGRVSIDNYMRNFLAAFYETGGTGPGAVLSIKGGTMSQSDKDKIRARNRRQFGPGNFLELMIVDNADNVTYTPMSLNRGLRDALPKEINAMSEARIAMVFGIPGSILGLLIGYESSSYANKRQDWQVLWDVTMTPLLSEMDDVLNLSLVPEFAGIDEVLFDLSDIRALQEDVDAIHKRARDNVVARIWTLEYAREVTGVGEAAPSEHYLLPDGSAVKAGDLDKQPEPVQEPAQLMAQAVRMLVAPRVGRPSIEEDEGARAVWIEAQELKAKFPNLTLSQLAARVGVSDRTLRRYREAFDDEEIDE